MNISTENFFKIVIDRANINITIKYEVALGGFRLAYLNLTLIHSKLLDQGHTYLHCDYF